MRPQRILIQAGHKAPRDPRLEAQTGTPGEIEFVSKVQHALVDRLRHDAALQPVPVPGKIDPAVKVDAALFLHADGVSSPSARGFCFGFPPEYEVNRRLAHLIAQEYQKIPGAPPRRTDNPTGDAAHYYGFALVDTPGPEVLIEHGFLTNPQDREWLNTHIAQIAEAEHNAIRRYFGLGGPAKITPDTTLMSKAPGAAADKAIRYLCAGHHGGYDDGDVTRFIHLYYTTASEVGLDPLLVVAQMIVETGHLTSWWSQRPRRNPAGIGVTGEPGVGLSFPDWDTAVHAHTGRLLAYCLPKGKGSPTQTALIDQALAFRPLPDNRRGCAQRLRGLAGTWAMDQQYAQKISRIANDIRG